MAQLLTRVREAEERLAGLARALHSAWDEELREAQEARGQAAIGMQKAEAMLEAALAIGRDELVARLREVMENLRVSDAEARTRLEMLGTVEEKLRGRLESGTVERPSLPARTVDVTVVAAPKKPEPPPFPDEDAEEIDVAEAAPPRPRAPPAPPRPVAPKAPDAAERVKQLGVRIDEVVKVAPKLAKDVLRLAVEEHVALARALSAKVTDGSVAPLLTRLSDVAKSAGFEGIAGLADADTGDWNKLAADARAKRLALMEQRKKTAPAKAAT